jgi:hypothetical protein
MTDRNLDYDYAAKQRDITREQYAKGTYIYAGYSPATPLVWNVEDQPIGSGAPANVFDAWGEDLEVRAIPVDGKEPLTPFTKELHAKTGNPGYLYGLYFTLLLDGFDIDLNNGKFRVEIVARHVVPDPEFQPGQYLQLGEDDYYPEWDTWRMFKAGFLSEESGESDVQSWHWEFGGELYNSFYDYKVNWEFGTPIVGYTIHQIEVDFQAGVFEQRIVGHWAGDQGEQSSWWVKAPRAAEFPAGEQSAQTLILWLQDKNSGEAMVTQLWLGPITDPFPNGAVLTSNIGFGNSS